MFKQKETKKERNDILSASRKFEKQKTEEKAVSKSNNYNQLKLKRLLLVYLTEDNQMYISRPAAFSLGLSKVRNIMIDNEDTLVPINLEQLNILKTKDIEIVFEKLPEDEKIESKEHIQVFGDHINNYITTGAAYALGLINVETFNNLTDEFYPISDNLLYFLKNKYEVEYTEINIGKKSR